MTHWNYRIVEKTNSKTSDVTYYIQEVYYDEAGELSSWIREKPLYGATLDDLKGEVDHLLSAFRRPLLKQQDDEPLVESDPPGAVPMTDFEMSTNIRHGFNRSLWMGTVRILHAIVPIEYGDPEDPEGQKTLPVAPMCWQHGPDCPVTALAKKAQVDLLAEDDFSK
jgi:hypothetical protein